MHRKPVLIESKQSANKLQKKLGIVIDTVDHAIHDVTNCFNRFSRI